MKKILIAILLTLSISTQAQVINENYIKSTIVDFHPIPKNFSYDGKTYMTFEDENNEGGMDIELYNDNIEKIKTIKVNIPENSGSYYIMKSRERNEETGFYTGKWIEYKSDVSNIRNAGVCQLKYRDFDYGYDYFWSYLSQILFNDDNKYEYLQFRVERDTRIENVDRDNDGKIDQITTYYDAKIVGINIVSETGDILQQITLPTLQDGWYVDLNSIVCTMFKINDKFYLRVHLTNRNTYKSQSIFYPINRSQSAIPIIGAPIITSVFPTFANNNEMITVEAEDIESFDREVVVTNVSGQTVYESVIPAGEKYVQINSGRLSKGVNIININDSKARTKGCKVVVR